MSHQTPTRISVHRTLALSAALAVSIFSSTCKPNTPFEGGFKPPRGVILISIDTLRADHLGCYGYIRNTSPFIDSLANRGVLFENAIVQLPGTLPSHMSIFTGLYPDEHGVYPPDAVLSNTIPTLPEILSQNGFRCAASTEGGYMSGRYGFDRGFEEYDDSSSKLPSAIETTLWRGLRFLKRLENEDRFFLFLHTYSVHDPYFPPVPYTTRYLDPELGTGGIDLSSFAPYQHVQLRPTHPDVLSSHSKVYKTTLSLIERLLPQGAFLPTGPNLVEANKPDGAHVSPAALDFYTALYDASINYTDDVLRSFFASLESEGLLDSSIVLLTSDHGEEFLEHGKMTHTQVYHECLHVPLIVLHPNARAPHRAPGLIRSVDIAPTLLELAGVSTDHDFSGISLARHLFEAGATAAEDAYATSFDSLSEALYTARESNGIYQLVLRRTDPRPDSFWMGRTYSFATAPSQLRFQASSFSRPRLMTMEINGDQVDEVLLTPEPQQVTVTVPPAAGLATVTLSADHCESPSDLGMSSDTRCLSFFIQGIVGSRQLFNLSTDPAGTRNLLAEQPDLAERLTARIGANRRSRRADSHSKPLDSETETRLKELGYLQ